MAAFAAFISGLVANVIAFLTQYMAKKTAIAVAYIGTWLTLAGTLVVALSTTLNALASTMPSFAGGILNMLPSNITICTSLVISVHVSCAAYDAYINMLSIKINS